jgi:SAM-dependent methyltransferase
LQDASANGLNLDDVQTRLSRLARQYRPRLQPDPAHARARHVHRIGRLHREHGVLVDLGGGISLHNGVLAQLGMHLYVEDLLGEYWERKASEPTSIDHEVGVLAAHAVQFIRQEISTCDLTQHFADNSVDVVTSFHCLEHLHQSSKRVLESAMRVLKPGGILFIEVPNAANARKRLALLCGYTNYLPYNLFYYSADYRGHIREYAVGDLHQLAENLGITSYRILGSNTYGACWIELIPSRLRKMLDFGLRLFPGLCGALLLEAEKS